MSVGIAFSGGGIPAAISAACTLNALVETYPSLTSDVNNLTKDVMVSTVSGGSIGYGLWVNARERIQFSPYRYNMTIDELRGQRRNTHDVSTLSTKSPRKRKRCAGNHHRATKITVGDIVGNLFSRTFVKLLFKRKRSAHWWGSVIEKIFSSVCVDRIESGAISWVSSFAIFNQSVLFNVKRNHGILLPSSANELHFVIVDMNSGDFHVMPSNDEIEERTNDKRLKTISVVDSLAYSSAFWATDVLRNDVLHLFLKKALIKAPRTAFFESTYSDNSEVVVLDGGVIDTTGIIALLKQKKDHIVAFYNNNLPLSAVSSSIAYLFGVDATTDAMNSLKGSTLSQVFPSSVYSDVIKNLTDSRIGVAHLVDVEVVQNHMGVEPYKLSSLLIFSNGRHEEIRFEDKRIRRQLSHNWPDNFPYGLPTLDANALCAFSHFKVKHHGGVLEKILT